MLLLRSLRFPGCGGYIEAEANSSKLLGSFSRRLEGRGENSKLSCCEANYIPREGDSERYIGGSQAAQRLRIYKYTAAVFQQRETSVLSTKALSAWAGLGRDVAPTSMILVPYWTLAFQGAKGKRVKGFSCKEPHNMGPGRGVSGG